jgi:hypothetical protein
MTKMISTDIKFIEIELKSKSTPYHFSAPNHQPNEKLQNALSYVTLQKICKAKDFLGR